MLSILHLLGIFAGDWLAFLGGLLGIIASSVVLCCTPKVGAAGCGYIAALVLGVIATLVYLVNSILTIVFWSEWLHVLGPGFAAILAIALIFHLSVSACTITLVYKCNKAYQVAKNEAAAPQTVVNYPGHPGGVVTGAAVEMAPPAYEKA